MNVGLFYLRQIFFARYDIDVHTSKEAQDYTALWNTLREKISLVKGGKHTAGQGTFNHISGGYDAGYYGYTYSLVFASDMYATVFKPDPLDPQRGKLYRDKILLPGGSRDDIDGLKVSFHKLFVSGVSDRFLLSFARTSLVAHQTPMPLSKRSSVLASHPTSSCSARHMT